MTTMRLTMPSTPLVLRCCKCNWNSIISQHLMLPLKTYPSQWILIQVSVNLEMRGREEWWNRAWGMVKNLWSWVEERTLQCMCSKAGDLETASNSFLLFLPSFSSTLLPQLSISSLLPAFTPSLHACVDPLTSMHSVDIPLYWTKNDTCYHPGNGTIQSQLEPYVNASSIGRYTFGGVSIIWHNIYGSDWCWAYCMV